MANGRDDRRAEIAQKDENDHHDEADGKDQLELHILNRRPNRRRPIG